ncbi:aminopeptidase [Marivirga tractuosa]|uniref:Aminopeptidase n=1 Tax=Marivirga tractuosa (strain ATCC 23168 / DSM 4126 / NBRC 15989 / NCIMB 1408 / VKM B-1430 / H-43) TaxID=643867 RepID=E4TLR7_MARTH|nr:aminopeptidase [Marivirga tractuosa]ADR23346.1 aminopeptidase [Marivirga tractuosa DSM 4126]BDD15980.1 aminopeptidase [Marivirga tractuosa]
MKSIFRKILLLTITIIMMFVVIKWDLLQYGWQQAKGQFSIMYNAEPLDTYLNKASFPDSLKAKIRLVENVKAFAKSEIGFSSESQYQKMFDQKGKELMWVVTAAYPYKLENYEWKFPLLGKLSYKGFFIEKEALKLEKELKNQGFDVRLRTASAWSTLGWLNDPLLSNVLQYSNGRLAELIFHELTHDEIFIKDSVDFNENLASFFGQEFTKMFFEKNRDEYGQDYKEYISELKDRNALNQFIRNYLPKFDSLYQELEGYSTTEKENQKYYLIEKFKEDLQNQKFTNPKYKKFSTSEIDVNNAYLLAYKRYSGHQQLLEKELEKQFDRDIKRMLEFYQKNFNSL